MDFYRGIVSFNYCRKLDKLGFVPHLKRMDANDDEELT